ncbi:hypothetical protein [Streptomyces sp. S.PB5]|uniref:hypothetical protein n=1 Tax=Streptomyces sp. S.PB5 TaxID=3020844 RepID=UPI0025AF2B41|nr:hypothetical protein [Streptomyces sp. S.PB5]MDN3023842.1 hypothetical protein [Streptomyces sp. S.PB5]
MADAYEALLDAELAKALDVWSSYLDARTGEDPEVRAGLRVMLDRARRAVEERDHAGARRWVADLYEEARRAALPWAPERPRPHEADAQARDYAKDARPHAVGQGRRDRLDTIELFLWSTGRRLRTVPGLVESTLHDIHYITARAGMALDLAHPVAAQRELDRLKEIARRVGAED